MYGVTKQTQCGSTIRKDGLFPSQGRVVYTGCYHATQNYKQFRMGNILIFGTFYWMFSNCDWMQVTENMAKLEKVEITLVY